MHAPRRVAIPALCLGMIGAQLAIAHGAAAAIKVSYVSPGGSGSSCTKALPCQLVGAMTAAGNGDVIVMEPGTYPGPGVSYTTKIGDSGNAFTLMGEPGAAAPVISSNAKFGGVDFAYGSTLSHVQIDYTGNGEALQLDESDADHVTVVADSTASGPGSAACNVGGAPATLIDSLCLQVSPDGDAIGMAPNGGTFSAVLRNDTALATGAAGVGLDVGEIGNGTMSVVATNSIFKAATDDVTATGTATGTASVRISHCDFKTTSTATGGTIVAGAGNVGAVPIFTDGAHGDFREKPTSPTVDAGTGIGIGAHEVDLAAAPRILGKQPDIGAYELAVKPHAGKLHLTSKAQTALHLSVPVNPEGLPTTVVIKGKHGSHSIHSKVVSAGSKNSPKVVRLTLTGLRKHTTYRLHAVVHNSVGSANSRPKSATTKKARHHR